MDLLDQEIHDIMYSNDPTRTAIDPYFQGLDRPNIIDSDYMNEARGYSTVQSPQSMTQPNIHAQDFADHGGWNPAETGPGGSRTTWSPPGLQGRYATDSPFPGPVPGSGSRGVIISPDGVNLANDPLREAFIDRSPGDLNQGIQNSPINRWGDNNSNFPDLTRDSVIPGQRTMLEQKTGGRGMWEVLMDIF